MGFQGIEDDEGFEALTPEQKAAWWEAFFQAHPDWPKEKLPGYQRQPLPLITKEEAEAAKLPYSKNASMYSPQYESVEEEEVEGEKSEEPMAVTAEQQKEIDAKTAKILKISTDHPDWSQSKIGEQMGMSQSEVFRYQRRLRKEGKLPESDRKFGGNTKAAKPKKEKERPAKKTKKKKTNGSVAMVVDVSTRVVRAAPPSIGVGQGVLEVLRTELVQIEAEREAIQKTIDVLERRYAQA